MKLTFFMSLYFRNLQLMYHLCSLAVLLGSCQEVTVTWLDLGKGRSPIRPYQPPASAYLQPCQE